MSKFQNGHKVPLRSQLKSYPPPFKKDNVQQKLDLLVQRHQKNNSLGFNKELTIQSCANCTCKQAASCVMSLP
jgi:hypothetical protein